MSFKKLENLMVIILPIKWKHIAYMRIQKNGTTFGRKIFI
jgi:hypothetical protein